MHGCTATAKPRIAILMAVYEPRIDWLREQLLSLNAQTYPNLYLYVRDDCSSAASFEQLQTCLRECVTAFSYSLFRNEQNLGSNGTFERLTCEADGECFAYCDQDDIWLPDKLCILQAAIEQENALLVCSDMNIIDGAGNRTADSITKIRRHHVFQSGTGLAPYLLRRNFVTGCTMLVRAENAKKAVPLCPCMVHDHYIALCCAAEGKIFSSPEKTICYRVHGGNQTGIMTGVQDKESYYFRRIEAAKDRLLWLDGHFPYRAELADSLHRYLLWVKTREKNWLGKGHARELWKQRGCGKQVTVYELVVARLPERLFMVTIRLAQRNLL